MTVSDPTLTLLSGISAGVLALIFARAALHKFMHRYEFQGIVSDYHLLPESLTPALARLLPVIEVALVAAVLVPSTRSVAALGMAALLALYALAIGINLKRGRTSIDCGCGGQGQGISPAHVIRNGVYGVIALCAMVPAPPADFNLYAACAGVLCVGLLWIVVVIFEQLLITKTHIQLSKFKY